MLPVCGWSCIVHADLSRSSKYERTVGLEDATTQPNNPSAKPTLQLCASMDDSSKGELVSDVQLWRGCMYRKPTRMLVMLARLVKVFAAHRVVCLCCVQASVLQIVCHAQLETAKVNAQYNAQGQAEVAKHRSGSLSLTTKGEGLS